ncbi:hypothetical protein ACFLZ9_02440 [Patescibacteria group bacterium]
MNKPNINNIQDEVERKYNKRDKKQKLTMKVSGAKVKKLQRIIKDK